MSPPPETGTSTTAAWQPPRGNFFADTWANFKRWTRKLARQPTVIGGMVFQPIAWVILFTQVFQNVVGLREFESESYLEFFLPAVILFLAPFAAIAAGINLVEDIESGMFEKILATPMSRTAVFLGKTFADLLRVVVQSLIIVVLGYAIGARFEAGLLGALGMIGVALLVGVLFLGGSTMVGLYTQNSDALQTVLQAVLFPLIFLSSAFMPLELLPAWVQFVATINPITYGIDAARAIMLRGWVWEVILPPVGVLVALDIVFGAGAVYMLNRATKSR
ncbi:MAG: ABC transporter permease [Halobacteriales archaeon]